MGVAVKAATRGDVVVVTVTVADLVADPPGPVTVSLAVYVPAVA
jgi:hypothetical protein